MGAKTSARTATTPYDLVITEALDARIETEIALRQARRALDVANASHIPTRIGNAAHVLENAKQRASDAIDRLDEAIEALAEARS